MKRDTVIQWIAAVCLALSIFASGRMLPILNATASEGQLRYTDVAVEGAPTPVVVAQSVGVLRGLIVNYLWIRADKLKEEGKFYEASHLASWITDLQPRFGAVWAFQAWNMSYNISVTTKTQEERWNWVNNGIRLLRDEGVRYNPDNMALYRELAWHFFHKVGGITDDAHLYYKQQLADEWQGILGEPPYGTEERIAAIESIARAPRRLSELEVQHPEVASLIEDLRNAGRDQGAEGFDLDERLLRGLEMLRNLQAGYLSSRLGFSQQFADIRDLDQIPERVRDTIGAALLLRPVRNNPSYELVWPALIAYVRRKVLDEDYNMDAALMAQFMRDYGPLDWRNAYAHTAYWAAIGVERGLTRFNQDGYDQINTDRLLFFTAQSNRREGLLIYDFVSKELSFGPDLRFVDYYLRTRDLVISRRPFQERPGSIENYIEGTRNFLIDAVREAYQFGEYAKAEEWYALLRDHYADRTRPDRFLRPIQQFIEEENADRYTNHQVARGDINGLMYQAYVRGLAAGNQRIFDTCIASARRIYDYYMKEIGNQTTLITEQDRMAFDWDEMMRQAFLTAMVGGAATTGQRLALWERAPDSIKVQVYDRLLPSLQAMYEAIGATLPFDTVFPPPAGLAEWRAAHGLTPEGKKADIEFERK